MTTNQQDFIRLCIDNRILTFGKFTLKSGRVSPYFFNAGLFNTGSLLGSLSHHYAKLIHDSLGDRLKHCMLYGPAYKGIPLAAGCAIRIADAYGIPIPYAFNRKEAKDHGEGGNIVGAALAGEVIIIDDVITAGTSVEESISIIRAAGANPAAVIIALDRQETAGESSLSAVQAVESDHGIPVHAILRLADLVEQLAQIGGMETHARAVSDYRARYGIQTS